MNTILLQPTDVLFFRDGRPMEGSLAGHGSAWPMPNVVAHALHAALHRAELSGVHAHRIGRSGLYNKDPDARVRKFGSLTTAGPFPVRVRSGDKSGDGDEWFFPRPLDLLADSLEPSLRPALRDGWNEHSSLPAPARLAVANRLSPTKDKKAKGWMSKEAFEAYLIGDKHTLIGQATVNDAEFSDIEHSVGIGIDPDTQTTGQGAAEGQIYSAHYLRLRDDWRLGVIAEAWDKTEKSHKRDLIPELLTGDGGAITIGGQQRICTAAFSKRKNNSPLPLGRTEGFNERQGKWLVKWILLSPAIWPAMEEGASKRIDDNSRPVSRHSHPGGWLPNWIHATDGSVLLRSLNEAERRARRSANAAGKTCATAKKPIAARLVAAIVPKPAVVTGWALESNGDQGERKGGAKSTHLAVSAGAVYYFEADSPAAAQELAAALNWHGETKGTAIRNRRSTLLGEKGFGLGVCGTWDYFESVCG